LNHDNAGGAAGFRTWAASCALLFPLSLLIVVAAWPQTGPRELAVRLTAMTAVTGYEQAMADTLLTLLPGASRDRAGNVVLALGSGAPKRLAACPLDETGYVVGRVRPDGYLTLRRSPISARKLGPLFDQALEGQRVTIFGSRGPVPGVVAVRSVHLTRGRGTGPDEPFTVDDAIVDVGAAMDREALGLGIGVLSPVALAKRPQRYGAGAVAAPVAGRRAACAALLAAALRAGGAAGKGMRGTTVVAFTVEQNLSARGLLTLATNRGPFAETWIADASGAAASGLDTQGLAADAVAALGRVAAWELPVRYRGTPVETVSLADVDRLVGTIAAWMRREAAR
jgi:putative aminopeptidase FrvX